LKKAGTEKCKPVNTPLLASEKISVHKGTPLNTRYKSIVGSLQYLTFTRPDLAFAVNRMCQFLHAPTTDHMIAVKRILRYVRGTMDLGVMFQKDSSLRINAFSDADWGDVLMIDARLVVLQYTLVAISYRGVPENRLPSPSQVQKRSTSL
jgi:hypothetical protein